MPFCRVLQPFRAVLLKFQCDIRRNSPMSTRNIREARGLPPLSVLDIAEYGPGDDGDSEYSSTGLPSFSGWDVDSPLYRYQPMYYREQYLGDPRLCLRESVDYKIECGNGSPLLTSPRGYRHLVARTQLKIRKSKQPSHRHVKKLLRKLKKIKKDWYKRGSKPSNSPVY
jgi:hypothetical protein